MKSHHTWLFVVCITLLVGCTPLSPPAASSPANLTTEPGSTSVTPALSATATRLPSPTRLPTSTATIAPTPTPEPPTPVPLPLRSFEQHCATIKSSLPAGFLEEGTIFLYKQARPKGTVYRLQAKNPVLQALSDLPKGSPFMIPPAPDWDHLAYGTSDGRLLVLASSGEIQASQPQNSRWNGIQAWLDPQRLIMIHKDKDPIAVDAFNPFTGELETLNPGLKDVLRFSIESPGLLSWYVWKLVYDPSLTRLVYLRDYPDRNEFSMVMIDVNTQQTLWEYKDPQGAAFYMPVWSPDGRRLAFMSWGYPLPLEILTVNRDGLAVQWIEIQEDLGITNQLYWSPNGRYIAFNGNKSLYVLDTELQKVIDYCIPRFTGLDEDIGGPYPNIFWAPNDRQLIYQRSDAPALVIDLASEVAAPIVDSTSILPVGWLRDQP